MVALAATNSATPSLPRTLILSRLVAARREADLAQANVQNLRAQVDAAQATSQNSQNKVRNLASQADPTYGTRVQTGASAPPPVNSPPLLSGQSDMSSLELQSIRGRFHTPGAAPVFNTQGLAAGRIVNISA